jgi:hypothetical protein
MNDYLPYDLSLKMKEKGYDGPTSAYYNIYNKKLFKTIPKIHNEAVWTLKIEEAVEWLWLTYDIEVEPNLDSIRTALNSI